MKRALKTLASFTFLILWLLLSSAFSFQLITVDEARRPDDPRKYTFLAGPVPEPRIRVVGPAKTTTSPFNMIIELRPYGGAKINLNTLQVRYLKDPHVDLVPRIQKFIDKTGRTVVIKIEDAEAPPGKHRILFQVEDSNEQLGRTVLELTVVDSK